MNSNNYTAKPCPFCGNPPKVYNDGLGITVICANQDCPARFMGEIWLVSWNRRDGKLN